MPDGYAAAPGVPVGAFFEIADECTEKARTGNGGVATLAPPTPTLTLETDWPDQDEYEVRVYDERHGRRLLAAIELVSPGNKDRPESRRAFVAKVDTGGTVVWADSIGGSGVAEGFGISAEPSGNVFTTVEPRTGWRPVEVTERYRYYRPVVAGERFPTLSAGRQIPHAQRPVVQPGAGARQHVH